MKEQIAQFGDDNSLSGIISMPEDISAAANKPALVILNSGLLPRFGPNRLSVKIARAVSKDNRIVLRFDFAGIGESPPATSELSYDERAEKEIGEALTFLQLKFGVKFFLLTGICSGADASFLAALQDDRITGIIPIDFYSVSSKGYLIHSYKKRALSPKSWFNFLSGKSDLLNILKRVINNITVFKTITALEESNEIEDPLVSKTMNNLEKIGEGFKSLLEKHKKVLLIFSAGSPAYFNFQKKLCNIIEPLDQGKLFATYFLETADHGFTFTYHQKVLVDKIHQWVHQF